MYIALHYCSGINILQEICTVFSEHHVHQFSVELQEPERVMINMPNIESIEFEHVIADLQVIESIKCLKTSSIISDQTSSKTEENKLLALIESFPEPIAFLNSNGEIHKVNNQLCTIFNSSKERFIGENIEIFMDGFNFKTWFSNDNVIAETVRLKLQSEYYSADLIPTYLSNDIRQRLTGAYIVLKSEAKLGQHISVLKQVNDKDFSGIEATSGAMRKVIKEARKMALSNSSILISGETGTGKEVLARACHLASERAEHSFMTLSCAALPDDAAETELFGLGLPGEVSSKKGLFDSANEGTIFLDEVGEMSPKLQTKLLRVIQDGSFRRVDDEQEIKVNVRIIGSTKRDLLKMVSQGLFREDLYYRLNVLGLNIPALRERRSDIIPLAEYFIAKLGVKAGITNISISDDCRDFIESYPWPGNVRQLENVLIRAISLIEGNVIEIEHLELPTYTKEHGYLESDFEGTLDAAVKKYEADLLKKLYPAYPSTRQLAKKLGVSHTAIANKLRDYGIGKKS